MTLWPATAAETLTAKRLLKIALVLLLAWIFVPWAVYHSNRLLAEWQYSTAKKRWMENEDNAAKAWWKANPGVSLPGRVPLRIGKMPHPVVDAWSSDVLLDDGSVLTSDDLLGMRLGEAQPLPPAVLPRLLKLPGRTRTVSYADGTLRADGKGGGGRGTRPHGDELMVSRRSHYTSHPASTLPKPERGGLHALTDVVAATAGESSADYILRRNGQLHTLGEHNAFGELGMQRISADGVPGLVIGDVVAVDAGATFAVVLKRDGSVWTWGQYAPPTAPLAPPPEAFRPEVRQVTLPGRAIQIAAGPRAAYALLEDGTVWGWGDPTCGALGVSHPKLPPEAFDEPGPIYVPNSQDSRHRQPLLKPRRIEGPNDIVDIQALGYLAIALQRDGRLWGWGLAQRDEIGLSDYNEQKKYSGHCVITTIGELRVSTPRLVQGISGVKQAFLIPGATALITSDDTLWYLGTGCKLCNIEYETHEFRAEKWGLIAAQGMWCGKVDEITALRKAMDRIFFTRFPITYERGLFSSGRDRSDFPRDMFILRFRSVARDAYLEGYDEETRKLRESAVQAKYVESSPYRAWFDAIDLEMRDPSWAHLPRLFGGPDSRQYERTAILSPEAERAFRVKHCASIGDRLSAALKEVAALQREVHTVMQGNRWPDAVMVEQRD